MWYYKNILMVFWDWWAISYWDNKISYLENKRYGNKPTHMRIRFWEMDGQICCLRKLKKKKLIRKHAHTDNTFLQTIFNFYINFLKFWHQESSSMLMQNLVEPWYDQMTTLMLEFVWWKTDPVRTSLPQRFNCFDNVHLLVNPHAFTTNN